MWLNESESNFWKNATLRTLQKNPNLHGVLITRDYQRLTFLHQAASCCKDPQVIAFLIDGGESVNARDYEESTPLHVAARYNENPDIIRAFLEDDEIPHKPDVNAKDKNGRTPLSLAIEFNKNPEVAEVLKKLGGKE